MYHYWGFGLNILSEIEFPELLPARYDHPDVKIMAGGIPDHVLQLTSVNSDFEFIISDREYFLDIKNACKYYVKDGREVVIEPYEGVEGRNVRIYLLATVMAVVLLQRGLMPLHASGIVSDDKLILFTGDSGAGKSTTLAYLVSKGYRIFTDDVCVLQSNPQNPEIMEGIASYPMIKLWDDAILKLDNDAFRSTSFRVKPDADKYGYFFYDTFIKEPYPIDKIFIIKTGAEIETLSSRRLYGIEAFRQLEKQAYRNYLITNQILRELHFKAMSYLSRNAEIFEISRPANCTVEQLGAALQELF